MKKMYRIFYSAMFLGIFASATPAVAQDQPNVPREPPANHEQPKTPPEPPAANECSSCSSADKDRRDGAQNSSPAIDYWEYRGWKETLGTKRPDKR